MHSASGSAGISVIRKAPGEMAYIWVLSEASIGNKHYPKGIMLDSGAAVNICPVDNFPEYGIQSGRAHLRFQGCVLHGGRRGDEGALRGDVCEGSDLELGGAGGRRLATWSPG